MKTSRLIGALFDKRCVALAILCGLSLRCPAQTQVAWPPEIPVIDTQDDEYLGGVVFPRLNSVVADDPIRDFAPVFNEGGRIVYFVRLLDGGHSNWFFVFRDQLSQAQAATNPMLAPAVTTYGCGANDSFAAPQFSSDLKTLMFQSGEYYSSHGFHVPCYWDFAGRTIRRPWNTFIIYPDVRFSPDSRYIGFYFGGDSWGNGLDAVPQLYAQNIRTGKIFPISAQDGITTWAWTPTGKILYSRPLGQQQTNESGENYQAAYDSQIREHDLNSGADKPLIERGAAPFPSPDNRYIAFAATLPSAYVERTAFKPNRLNRAQLSLYDRQTKEIVPLETADFVWGKKLFCNWSADSKTLVVTRFSDTSKGKICSIKTLAIESLKMDASQKRVLSQVAWKSVVEANLGSLNFLRTQVKKLTRNGRYLILDLSQSAPNDKNYGLPTLETLEAVDLENGQTQILAHKVSDIDNSIGWDWIENSAVRSPQS